MTEKADRMIVGAFPQLAPRGLSRELAAAYVGIGATKFMEMVEDGRMPKPFHIDTRMIWDRYDLDQAIEELKAGGGIDMAAAKQALKDRIASIPVAPPKRRR